MNFLTKQIRGLNSVRTQEQLQRTGLGIQMDAQMTNKGSENME